MALRLLAGALALTLLGVLGACGDDDDAEAASTTSSTSTDGEAGDGDEAEGDDDTSTTTTTGSDDAAEPPPDDAGEDDGLGDPLVFIADLTAELEVPGPGDAAGSGRVEIQSATEGEWCIDMEATGLSSDVSDAHIHFGTEGVSGDPVIPIGAPTATEGDTDTWSDVCVAVDEQLAAEIVDAPQAFYANVHTIDHPGGAIRGQLEPSSLFDLTLD